MTRTFLSTVSYTHLNSLGQYDQTPADMAHEVKEYIQEGLINIIGGCCGTTDAYIAEYPALIAGAAPHVPAPKPESLWLSGLELLEVTPEKNFINVGAVSYTHLKKIYDAHREDLERERTDDEFMAMYEQYEAFDELEEEFLEKEEGITALIAGYVDEHLELFAKIV